MLQQCNKGILCKPITERYNIFYGTVMAFAYIVYFAPCLGFLCKGFWTGSYKKYYFIKSASKFRTVNEVFTKRPAGNGTRFTSNSNCERKLGSQNISTRVGSAEFLYNLMNCFSYRNGLCHRKAYTEPNFTIVKIFVKTRYKAR